MIECPGMSNLMLLRHLPVPDPFDPPPVAQAEAQTTGVVQPSKRVLVEGAMLAKKKPRVSEDGGMFGALLPEVAVKSRAAVPASSSLPPSSFASITSNQRLPSTASSSGSAPTASSTKKVANRFATRSAAGSSQPAKVPLFKPGTLAGRNPLPAPVITKRSKPLFQQPFH